VLNDRLANDTRLQKSFVTYCACSQMGSAGHRHYPAYHTVIDNFDYMERFVDPLFSAHVSVAQLAADVALQLSSSARLPFDVRELADTLELEYDSLQQDGIDQFNHLLRTYIQLYVVLSFCVKGKGLKVHLYSATIAASAALSSQTGPAYSVGGSPCPQSRTLACTHTT